MSSSFPGSFPISQKNKALIKPTSSKRVNAKLNFKTNLSKIRNYFHGQSSFWRKSKDASSVTLKQQHGNTIGSLINVTVPISISNTTHYHGGSHGSSRTITTLIQQWVILSPFQIYGFMFLFAFLLFVIAFGILQIHRTISILQIAANGIRYTLVANHGEIAIRMIAAATELGVQTAAVYSE
ncbi:uncharacterized protein BX663DRAFT_555441 [Cokeromyces recurvatus]|uniref:uncharacterized protein n=1 Tax=Cokeromyces recurvatus TaxID=90255 RepID=UPI002220C1BD|nr:uncharacterized protein BX663DRAFT_555441 [Cokeromyces recurvatus]KAI7898894.1 hypothetical protein BX663DRAFT_555441 [Cokeromyces recurvatus]